MWVTPRGCIGVGRDMSHPKVLHWVLRAVGAPRCDGWGGARPGARWQPGVNHAVAQPPGRGLCQAVPAARAWLCLLIGWRLPVGAGALGADWLAGPRGELFCASDWAAVVFTGRRFLLLIGW